MEDYVRVTEDPEIAESGVWLVLEPLPEDVTPPTPPTGLSLSAGAGQASAAWTPGTDDVALARHEVSWQPDGGTATDWVATSAADAHTITGLAPATTYTVRVRAVDTAGNASDPVSGVVTTPASSSPPALEAWDAGDLGGGLAHLDPVEAWVGAGGLTLAQADPDRRPSFHATAMDFVRFDGSGAPDALAVDLGQTLPQPNTIAALVRFWQPVTGARIVVDGIHGDARQAVILRNMSGEPRWRAFAGSSLTGPVSDPGTAWHVVVLVVDGAGSTLRVDGVPQASGSCGADPLTGLTLASRYDQGHNHADLDVAALRVYGTALDAAEVQAVEEELAAMVVTQP